MTTSRWEQTWGQLTPIFLLIVIATSALLSSSASSAKPIGATVIDRFGNRHDLSGFKIKDRTELEYYVGVERRTAGFDQIDKLVVDGASGDEERPVKVHLRTGRVDAGRLFTGGHGASTAQDFNGGSAGSGARAPTGVSGKTSLGPWLLSLDDVREVRFRHPLGGAVPTEVPALNAAVVTTQGGLFEITDLLVGEKQILRYMRNRRKMTLKLSKVERIQFAEYSAGQEQRSVTITLWTGKMLRGSVDATVARFAGETDRQYARRTGAAVTGKLSAGAFSAGMHEIKLIRFHPAVEHEESQKAEARPSL